MNSRLPTIWALLAIVLWASLAMTSSLLKGIPPFFQMAVAFTIGGMPAMLKGKSSFPPVKVLLLGVAGYFGYHFFLFTSFKLAPPVEANLINYLWPMLMVLLSPLFFKESKLKAGHLVGAVLALAGVVVLLMPQSFSSDNIVGYCLAAAAAFTWPTYSLLKRKTPPVPLLATAAVCLATALLCWVTHYSTEEQVIPTGTQWLLLLWLGVGPFGAAFFLWDVAVREGDPRVIGALSYLTPVLSTIMLVVVAGFTASTHTWIAMGLMTTGSLAGTWLTRERK